VTADAALREVDFLMVGVVFEVAVGVDVDPVASEGHRWMLGFLADLGMCGLWPFMAMGRRWKRFSNWLFWTPSRHFHSA
jgi:hypothetical protein